METECRTKRSTGVFRPQFFLGFGEMGETSLARWMDDSERSKHMPHLQKESGLVDWLQGGHSHASSTSTVKPRSVWR